MTTSSPQRQVPFLEQDVPRVPGTGPAPSEIRLVIPGTPIPKNRPRYQPLGANRVRPYSDQKKQIRATRWEIRRLWRHAPLAVPVELSFTFFMPIPKSTPKYRIREMGLIETPHVIKPDLDNLEKFYLDCMQGLVYADDSQAWHIRDSKKIYGLEVMTEITVIVDPKALKESKA